MRQSLEETRAGLRFKQPKSKKARTIKLPLVMVNELVEHRKRHAADRLAFGPGYNRIADLVCARPDGKLWKPSLLTLAFDLIAKRLQKDGYPRVTFHGLCHSHATLLFNRNEHPKVVSERLGHSSIQITYNLYAHVIPGMRDAAAAKVEAALNS